jgi:hypothetical protein
MITIEQLFGTLQQSVVATWRKHLRTAKYAKHIALNDFYEDMPEKVDALIEAWMGANGRKIKGFENILQSANMNTLTYLKELKKVAKQGYELMGENDELVSLLDDIMELINSTLYKVKELNESVSVNLSDYINEALNESMKKDAVLKKDYKWIDVDELETLVEDEIISEVDGELLTEKYGKDDFIVFPKGTEFEFLESDRYYEYYNIRENNIEICINVDYIDEFKQCCK